MDIQVSQIMLIVDFGMVQSSLCGICPRDIYSCVTNKVEASIADETFCESASV